MVPRTEKKGKSPYAKHNKAPFKYSTEYYNWRAALKSGNQGHIDYCSREWNRKFGPASEVRRSGNPARPVRPIRGDEPQPDYHGPRN